MRVIIFFDLPMLSEVEVKRYTRFRKYLIKSGYIAEPDIAVTKEADQLNFVLQFNNEILDIRGIKL